MKKVVLFGFLLLLLVPTVFGQTRIRFARGRTSTSVTGTLSGTGERDFVLAARAGQSLSANVSSRGGCVIFSTVSTSMSFTTDAGDNWLKLMNRCNRPASFTMTISIG
jgi:hypothetical protein